MDRLIYDGTFIGLLSGVFESYERKLPASRLVASQHFQPEAFGLDFHVSSNTGNASRVWTGLQKKVSVQCLKKIHACFLSEQKDISDVIHRFMRLAFASNESPENDFGNPDVLRISQTDRAVQRERHRMEAFVRFSLTDDGLFWSVVDPDFNVLPLLTRHFRNRYADQRWLIYDQRRNYGIYYDLNEVTEITFANGHPEKDTNHLHSDEKLYQQLWSDYFRHVNISERKNSKLHLMHVPKRYWKNLTEKLI